MERRTKCLAGLAIVVAALATGCGGSTTDEPPEPKRLFVTRATLSGSLGGLTGADGQCNTFAAAANLGGTWKAWLSDSTTNALDRIADVGPWVDMSGAQVFRDKAELMGLPEAGVHLDETKQTQASPLYWTGTAVGGSGSGSNCGDWTGSGEATIGNGTNTSNWTDYGMSSCSVMAALLCFQQ